MRFSGGRVNVSERHVNLWRYSRAAHVRGARAKFLRVRKWNERGRLSSLVVSDDAMIHTAGRRVASLGAMYRRDVDVRLKIVTSRRILIL